VKTTLPTGTRCMLHTHRCGSLLQTVYICAFISAQHGVLAYGNHVVCWSDGTGNKIFDSAKFARELYRGDCYRPFSKVRKDPECETPGIQRQ
jgi:hypothetical protein